MSKHREEEHEEEGGSERYLITYSDLMTLLLALFIILYSIAQVDAKKFAAVAQQFNQQMGTQAGTGTGTGVGPGVDTEVGGGSEAPGLGEGEGVQNALDKVYEALKDYVGANHLEQQIALTNTDNYVKIHIKDTLMFVPDSASLLDQSRPVLENIQKAIAQVYQEVDYITFSGHTADVGDHSLASDQTSWRLSTERAITVLNDFISYGLPQNKLSIQGFAHFDPIAPNDTEDGRAQNRRVEITIYKYPTEDKSQFQQDVAKNSEKLQNAE